MGSQHLGRGDRPRGARESFRVVPKGPVSGSPVATLGLAAEISLYLLRAKSTWSRTRPRLAVGVLARHKEPLPVGLRELPAMEILSGPRHVPAPAWSYFWLN